MPLEFSRRLRWAAPRNALAEAIALQGASGAALLDLTESNPTRAGFPYPQEALHPLSDPAGLLYQPLPSGLDSARQCVRDYYHQLGVDVPIERILLTASTSEAYSFLFQLLANPGDEILSPRPSYPLFEFLAGLSSVVMRPYPLRYDGAWHIDFAALEKAISPRSRAIVIVNPNNPTGSFLKLDELAQLEAVAARHNLVIIADEVFGDYAFGISDQLRTLAGERRALTFSMSGLSKVAGFPQLKLGWIVASGPQHGAAIEALELIADTFLSVSTPVQIALPKLFETGRTIRAAIAERTIANLETLRSLLKGTPATILNTEGGWYAILRVPNTRSEEEWVLRLLREANVVVQPGYYFDFDTEAYLVVSLLTPGDTFTEGVRRLRGIL